MREVQETERITDVHVVEEQGKHVLQIEGDNLDAVRLTNCKGFPALC